MPWLRQLRLDHRSRDVAPGSIKSTPKRPPFCASPDILDRQDGRPVGEWHGGTDKADCSTFKASASVRLLRDRRAVRRARTTDVLPSLFWSWGSLIGHRYRHVVDLRAARSRIRLLWTHTRLQTCEPVRVR